MPLEPIEFDHETPPDFGDEPLPRRSRASTPPVTPTPDLRQQQPEPEIYQPQPSRPTNPQPSVFGGEAATPMLPGTANQPAPVLPDTRPIAAARSAAAVPPTSGALPTLPVANPAAAPAVTAPIETAPSTPDINALRSAQLRANRQQQKGKVFGRSLLAFMVIAGLIAGALIFGRSYLFTTEWDAALTPIVDDIQESTGVEFDHTIPLVVQPADEYAQGLLDSTLGTDWTTSVPAWRALGLASGDVTEASVATVLAQRSSAYYDPIADVVFQAEGAEPEQAQSDLQVALAAAYQQQLAGTASDVVETSQIGVTGVSTQQTIARNAADAFTIRRTVTAAFGAWPEPITDPGLPIPIAYELAAVDRLGEAILTAAGADPTVLSSGAGYPDAIYGVLGDNPVNASSVPLKAGEQPLADALALGVDDWSLVWGSRLPRSTVDRLAALVTADSYRPIERSGATCFVAVFQSATEAEGTSLYGSMLLWAQRGPADSQALATQLGPTRVQLEACDPGSGTPIVARRRHGRLPDRATARSARWLSCSATPDQSRKLLNCSGIPISPPFSSCITSWR